MDRIRREEERRRNAERESRRIGENRGRKRARETTWLGVVVRFGLRVRVG